MKIDPHAWLLTTPLTIAIIQIYSLPAEHMLRRVWRYLTEIESLAWERLGWEGHPLQLSRSGVFPKAMLAVVCSALMVTSIASFAAFLAS